MHQEQKSKEPKKMTDDEIKALADRLRPPFWKRKTIWFTFAVGFFIGTVIWKLLGIL